MFNFMIYNALSILLILFIIFPKLQKKEYGFITKFIIGVLVIGLVLALQAYGDYLLNWFTATYADDPDAHAYAQMRFERVRLLTQNVDVGLLFGITVLESLIVSAIFAVHTSLKKKGKSWKNL